MPKHKEWTREEIIAAIFERPIYIYLTGNTGILEDLKSSCNEFLYSVSELMKAAWALIQCLGFLLWKLLCVIGYPIFKAMRLMLIRGNKKLRREYLAQSERRPDHGED